MKKISIIITLFCAFNISAQTCIQKLDSAEYFKYRNQEKAKFYAASLLADLDSTVCLSDIGIAGAYNNIGLIFWEANDKPRSLYAFHSGLTHELKNKDSINSELLGLYYNLSSLYQDIGSFQKAEKYIRLAGRVVDKFYEGESKEQLKFLFLKGVYYREVGDFNQSLNTIREAIELNGKENFDSTGIALQIELGTIYRHFGDLKQSEIELLKAVDLAKDKNELQYLTAIDRLSSLKIEQGEYSESENYLLYNLKRKQESYASDSLLILETLNGLSVLYYKLNDLKSANEYMKQALNSSQDIRNIRPYMINNLGTIYMKMGDIDNALLCFQESSEGFRELYGSMNPDYASCINNLAGIYKLEGLLGEALNLYTKVLDMDKVIYGSRHQRYATSLNNVALVYLQLGHYTLAGKLLDQASKIRKDALGEYHPLYIKTLNDLGVYYLIMENKKAAMDRFNLALKLEIKHMQDIFPVLTDKQRKLYFDEARYNVERFNSLAFSDEYIDTPYAQDALNHFINTKGVLFYASEKMRRVVQNSADKQTQKIYNDWREKKYQLAQAFLLAESERKIRKISMDDLERECAQLEKKLALKFKVFSDQERSSYHDWKEISDALEPGTATVDMIQYRTYSVKIIKEEIDQGFEDQSNYIAFIIKPGGELKAVKLSENVDFVKGFSQYRNALKYGIKDQGSYFTFWEPIDEHLEDVEKLHFAPDGIFHKLNPGVFFDPKKNEYVADNYDIINITSSKDLLYSEKKQLITEAKIFGNPDFSKLDLGFELNQLPGAEREAQNITEILDVRKWKTNTYYYSDATEERIKNVSNPGVIHLATHGYFDDDPNHKNPLNSSGIFLSRDEYGDNDGRLTAYEAMNMLLDQTSVVVLAACETGLGTVQNGEGVFGLQRAFLVAGAENVILSLVKINDEAARNFMTLYYQQLLVQKDVQQAFFSAREQFKKVDPNPYNWGAYILVSKG